MSDIVQEAQGELERGAEDFWGIKQFHLGGTHRVIVLGLLERIQQLELEVTLNQPLYSRRQLEARLEKTEQERDAALETLRLVRLSQSVNKSDVIRAETQREYADARVLRMVGKMDEARRGEAAALERVRKLEEAPDA